MAVACRAALRTDKRSGYQVRVSAIVTRPHCTPDPSKYLDRRPDREATILTTISLSRKVLGGQHCSAGPVTHSNRPCCIQLVKQVSTWSHFYSSTYFQEARPGDCSLRAGLRFVHCSVLTSVCSHPVWRRCYRSISRPFVSIYLHFPGTSLQRNVGAAATQPVDPDLLHHTSLLACRAQLTTQRRSE